MENNKQSGINVIFEQRKLIYHQSFPFSAPRRRALKVMRGSDATFEEWMRVYDDPDSDPNLKKVALSEMFKKAVTIDEWVCVYNRLTHGNRKQKALNNISKINADFEKLTEIYRNPNSDRALRKTMNRKMEELISS